MTPFEKAVELRDKFLAINNGDGEYKINNHEANMCVMILVDAILNTSASSDFWFKVKNQIMELK